MLRYIYRRALHRHPKLAETMFKDRADQFARRLGWDVDVNDAGEERDQYDALDPLYVIWEQADGTHGGSLRLLPTTGPVMVNDVFGHLIGGPPIHNEFIWECTRFCLSRSAPPRTAAALMLGGGEIMSGFGLRHFAGVFEPQMERIYRSIGSSPVVLGSQGEGRAKISLGMWSFTDIAKARVARRAGLSQDLSKLWFRRAFGVGPNRSVAERA